MEIAGHQFQRGLLEARAAAVGHGDPAVEIGGAIVAADGEHVVGDPVHRVGQVRRLDLLLLRPVVVERHDERRPAVKVLWNLRKAVLVRLQAGDDFVPDLPHRPFVEREQCGRHLFGAGRAVLGPPAHQPDFAADVFLQELHRVEEVVLIVLLEDAEPRGIGQRAQVHRGRVDGRGDVAHLEIEGAVRQRQLTNVADERDVGVVDRDAEIGLIAGGRRRTQGLCRGSRAFGVVAGGARRVGAAPGHDNADARRKRERRNVTDHEVLPSGFERGPHGFLHGGPKGRAYEARPPGIISRFARRRSS